MTNGAPQLARHGEWRLASISTGSSEQACATSAVSTSRITLNRWGAAKAAPTTAPSTTSIVIADQAGNFLEHHVLAIDTGAANHRLVSQHEGRADIRMSGERHLGAGRENAHAGGMGGIGRREDERGLGEVEFVGNRLHLRFGQATRVRDYRDGIAPELPIGEYVDGLEFHFRQWRLPD